MEKHYFVLSILLLLRLKGCIIANVSVGEIHQPIEKGLFSHLGQRSV